MLRMTQILTTSKACKQTGVNLIVTFKMDIDKQAAPLRKRIEKLEWQIHNAVLSDNQIAQKKTANRSIKTTDSSIGGEYLSYK